jgi:uncharacterized protein
MAQREQILETLEELKEETGNRYKVRQMGLFGSFVRSEESETSDVDILVEFEEGADLLDLVGLGDFLEEKLGRKVDLVTKKALRPEIRDRVIREVAMV